MTNSGTMRQAAAGSVAALAIVLAVQTYLALGHDGALLRGALADTDAYLRLARVRELITSWGWFDPLIARANPPDGFVPHWTRPLDLLLVVGTGLLLPFLEPAAALHWAGVFLGPLLQVALVAAALWATAPLMRGAWLWLVAVLLVCQPLVISSFMVGRPDHHGLLLLLFVLALGCSIRQWLRPADAVPAIWGGALGALGLWVSVEFLVYVAVDMALLGAAWLLGVGGAGRLGQRKAAALFGLTVAFVGIERGPDLVFEADRLSLSHAALTGLLVAVWTALRAAEGVQELASRGVRALALGVAGAAALAILLPLRPELMPMAAVDPLYYAKSFVHTQEIRPTLVFPPFSWDDTVLRPITYLGPAVLALPGLWWLLRRAPTAGRWAWLAVGAATAVYLPLAVHQVRWAGYAEALLVLPYAAVLGEWAARMETALRPGLVTLMRPLGLAAAAVWIYFPAMVQSKPYQGFAETHAGCPVGELSGFLSDPAGLGGSPKRIMALYDFGPGLLYRTPHSVLALPMHRPHAGYGNTYRAMTASDPGEAERIMRAAGVDLVLVCDGAAEATFYWTGNDGDLFWKRLVDRRAPDFLRAVPLPDRLGETLRLYSVMPPPVANGGG